MAVVLYRGRDSTERASPLLSLPCPASCVGKCVTRRSAITPPPSSLFLPAPLPSSSPLLRSRAVSTGESKNYTLPGPPHNEFLFIVRCHAVLERGCRSERGFGEGRGRGGGEASSRGRDRTIHSRYTAISSLRLKEGRKEFRKG